jgi:hypothetical protein
VFATKDFKRDSFLLNYHGDLKSANDGDVIEDQTYVYYFQHGSKEYW